MRRGNYIPERGDLVWIDFTPQVGHEQRGKRPALILSPKIYNEKTSLCVCVPITSRIKGYPFEVELPNDSMIQGVILSDQIKSLDYSKRDVSLICRVDVKTLERVQKNVWALIGE